MNFMLSKTRLNTSLNALKKQLGSQTGFASCFDDDTLTLTKTREPLTQNGLESFRITYEMAYRQKTYHVTLHVMQSTPTTTYCFDVFLHTKAAQATLSHEDRVFQKQLDLCLEKLRFTYNGTWTITDDQLHLSCLK